jgi:hypothetical protein
MLGVVEGWQFDLRAGPVKAEIPSASLRAGSLLRLKNGSAQDDNVVIPLFWISARVRWARKEIPCPI